MDSKSLFSPSRTPRGSNDIDRYVKKIKSLNANMIKLNEMLEKSMRKSATLEKENIHLKKRLSESESLCIKLNQEVFNKNQQVEDIVGSKINQLK